MSHQVVAEGVVVSGAFSAIEHDGNFLSEPLDDDVMPLAVVDLDLRQTQNVLAISQVVTELNAFVHDLKRKKERLNVRGCNSLGLQYSYSYFHSVFLFHQQHLNNT